MVRRDDLVEHLDEYLKVDEIPDHGPMGLQVEGRQEVRKIVTGVSAHLALFEKAVLLNADLILVHHGLLWDRDSRVVKGVFKNRLKFLLEHDLSLLAYHLALDVHKVFGNSRLAARALDLCHCAPFGLGGVYGEGKSMTIEDLCKDVEALFQRQAMVFPYGPKKIRRIGICSGGAARELVSAMELALDVFITGEAAESTMQLAKEAGIHYIAVGHHATERLGIRALGEYIAKKFSIAVEFIDILNPV